MTTTAIELSLDALVRSVGINRSTPHALFLGAGASISSGVPSAELCIWEWKRQIFLTNQPGLESQFVELSLEAVRYRIQKWLNSQATHPTLDAPEEYGHYIEACFPRAEDRRAFFQERVLTARPHIGYRLVCHLAELGLIDSVWTTNFDGLTTRAAASFDLTPIEVSIDSQERLPRKARRGDLLCVSMHGDYRYDLLRNTVSELQEQEQGLKAALIDQVRQSPLIVAGYSGRDVSIMEALNEAVSVPGDVPLYWCGYGHSIPESVRQLIQSARSSGRSAHYIATDGFDDLMTRLALHCSAGERRTMIQSELENLATDDLNSRAPFEIPNANRRTVIKSNAFEIECPSELLQFELSEWPEHPWPFVREHIAGSSIVAAPLKRRVLALGTVDEIRERFADCIKSGPTRTPIAESELYRDDGVVISLLRSALVRAMTLSAGFECDERSLIWDRNNVQTEQRSGTSWNVHDAVLVSLKRAAGRQYAVLKPTLVVQSADGSDAPPEISKLIKQSRLSGQYNRQFNTAVSFWRRHLLPSGDQTVTFEFPASVGSTFTFRVRRAPCFADICALNQRTPVKANESILSLLSHRGLELPEPVLLFSNISATNHIRDTHPIRGVANNRPYDFALTRRGLMPSIRLGVICPQGDTRRLRTYLQHIHNTHSPGSRERDYLLDYPGFASAYGLPIEIPDVGNSGWVNYPDPHGVNLEEECRSLAQNICQSLQSLQASYGPSVALIFVPQRFVMLRGYRTDSESFDLHDFVKAFCVQRGLPTQFLEESTLVDQQQCRVWWWLGLALYVKSMRTPWVLESLDEDTAFVGLGFSIDRTAQAGRRVVLGCSHIYSSNGEGLQYRLSRIENPIFRGKNPYMSLGDARRLGETIRQLFFESRHRLPRRVVLHKRTPFLMTEREGLLDGLSGVPEVDMLELKFDPNLRYIAAVSDHNGSFRDSLFPVRRGTIVKLDDFSGLLWVHGSTDALNSKLTYYQGKRRIPTPLSIKRHVGQSDFRLIAEEILGLSKMDWNSFDLYSKLPATIQSSNEIARIGSLLARLGPGTFDYRLFI